MRLALLLGLLAFVNTCRQEDPEPEIITCYFPCIDSKISQLMDEAPKNPRVSITEIHTKNKGAFWLISGHDNVPAVLLNYSCEVVCHPDEGAAARTGSCPELTDITLQEVIWKDER